MPAAIPDEATLEAEFSRVNQQPQALPDQATLEAAARQSQQELAAEPKPYIQGVDNQLLEAAAKQSQQELETPAQQMGRKLLAEPAQATLDLSKRIFSNLAGFGGGLAQTGAYAAQLAEAPSLYGLSVDQVKAVRGQMQQELNAQNQHADAVLKNAAPDDTTLFGYLHSIDSLEGRIKEADNIIASGKPATVPSQMISPVGLALRDFGKRQSAAAIQAQLDQVFPTNQDFKNSTIGQIAYGGADALTLLAVQSAFGPFAATGFMASQLGQQTYQAKKEAGASDEDAERASALVTAGSAATMATAGPLVDWLAKSFSGLTPKGAIRAILRTGTHAVGGGLEQVAIAKMQDAAIGQLQGLDPNKARDQLYWQNFWMGALFRGATGWLAGDPNRASEIKPEVTTHNKSEAPPSVVTPEAVAQVVSAAKPAPTAQPPIITTDKEDPQKALDEFAERQRQLTAPAFEKKGVGPSLVSEPRVPAVPAARETFVYPTGAEPRREAPEQPVQVTVPSAETLQREGPIPVALTPEEEAQRQLQQRAFIPTPGGGPSLVSEARQPVTPTARETAVYPTGAEPKAKVTVPSTETLEAQGQIPPAPLQTLSPEEEQQRQLTQEAFRRKGEGGGPSLVSEARQPTAPAAARETAVYPTGAEPKRAAAPTPAPTGDPIREAYDRVRSRQLGSAVYISDLAKELGMPVSELQAHLIAREGQGQLMLEPGHWPTATPEQRAAAIPRTDARGMPEPALNVRYPQREEAEPAWYKEEAPAATRLQNLGREPVDRPVSQEEVKREVQTAQADMGMGDNLIYHPTVEDLPDHVKNGLTPAERNATAQIVIDHKLGNVHVIGDRFTTLNELRRAIIEEALPYRYRNVTELTTKHDPTDRDMGTYDHISDNPQLNTHALLSADRPYAEAARTAMEEINVHQGISKLLGPRWGRSYINAMDAVQSQFDRLKLNDILAQKKGYANADEMAKAYEVPDWRTDPRQAHKMTEELIGSYSRTFGTPEELAANGPTWYQNALRGIQNGIRRFLGLEVTPYDVQSLLHDSAAALRQAKYTEPSDFHPVGDQAKADMQDFRMANRLAEPGAGQEERADIGTAMVRGRIAELEASLQRGQQLRTQPLRLAMQTKRTIQERLGFLNEWPAIISHEGHQEVMQTALDMFRQDFGSDPNLGMQYIIDHEIPGARNAFLTEVVGRETTDRINALRAAGENEQADLLAARLDRMNAIRANDPTEAARALAAQRVLTKDGSANVADHRKGLREVQQNVINRRLENKTTIDKGKEAVDAVTKEAAGKLRDRVDGVLKDIGSQVGSRLSLPEQYLQDLMWRIHDAMFKTNTAFSERDTPALQSVYDTFRKNIQQIISERTAGVPVAQLELKAYAPSATDTLRTIMDNYPAYKDAWERTMVMLNTENPELAQRFARAIEEPVGETLANKLALEQGTNLRDLVYDHYSKADRITTDLATKIVRQTGMTGTAAQELSQHLQNIFGDIVRDTQRDRLQSILKSVGGNADKAQKGELDQLTDHIVIGGLDSPEWLNLVAPRFGLEHSTPEQIAALRSAGDYMAYLRNNGLSNSSIAQQVRTQMGDIMRLSRSGLARSAIGDQLRYVTDVYTSSLLTGPLTHAPYWQQTLMTQMINEMAVAARMMTQSKGEVNQQIIMGMGARMLDGFARGAREFMPILRSGIKPPEEFMPQRGGQPIYGGALQKVTPRLRDVGSWFANYKYVQNFLDAVSNLMVRGAQYATHHAIAMKLAWEDGLRGQDAYDAAERTVMGTPEMQARALNDSHDIIDSLNERFPDRKPLGEDDRKMLEGELLDQYKTTSQNPDSTLNDTETARLRDVARRAMAPAIRGAARGDVAGMWGYASRGLLDFSREYPAFKFLVPFAKVPFNLVNEFLSWTPIGLFRSAADVVPSHWPVSDWIKQVPMMREGIRGYLERAPGLAAQIRSGEISTEAMRDLAFEQMLKGIVGTSAAGVLYGTFRAMATNPNAPFRLTYSGPSQYGQREIERGKGWQPNSFYAFGGWHSYENSPWRAVLAGIGALEDYYRYEKQQPDAGMNEVAAHYRMMAGGLSSVFGSPLQGLETGLQLVRQTAAEGDPVRAVGNFLSQVVAAGVTVPFGGTAVRQIARIIDPTEYQSNGVVGKALRYVPVVNAWTGEPKLNLFGQPMTASPLAHFPEYSPGISNNDPVWNYLAEHPGLHLSMPGNSAQVARVKMSPDEIYEYHKARGPALRSMLERAFNDPHFAEMPQPTQNRIIQSVYERAANRVGQGAVIKYRQEHPITPERTRSRMTGITPEARAAAAQREEEPQGFQQGGLVEPPQEGPLAPGPSFTVPRVPVSVASRSAPLEPPYFWEDTLLFNPMTLPATPAPAALPLHEAPRWGETTLRGGSDAPGAYTPDVKNLPTGPLRDDIPARLPEFRMPIHDPRHMQTPERDPAARQLHGEFPAIEQARVDEAIQNSEGPSV